MRMTAIEFLNKHCEFLNPYDCYVLLAVSRKKDTPEITNSQEIVFREVIKSERDIGRKLNKVIGQVQGYRDPETRKSYPFYIYVSLNRRDSRKATAGLMKKILDWMVQEANGVDMSKMYKKLHGHFYSQLMVPESRSTGKKYFLIDFDEKDTIKEMLLLLSAFDIEPSIVQETPNGYHIKTRPFDRRDFEGTKPYDFEIKTDANLFVTYVANGEK